MDRVKTEHEEQREFVSWFRKNNPGVLIFAIPNGEKRGKAAAMRLKVEGVVSGIPDLFIPSWRTWLEMKREKDGRVSASQKEIAAYLQHIGHTVFVAYGKDQAIQYIKDMKMKKTQLKDRITELEKELNMLKAVEPGCPSCRHFARNGVCGLFEEAPPLDVMKAGCEAWSWDEIPF
jgi:hypothetical protein